MFDKRNVTESHPLLLDDNHDDFSHGSDSVDAKDQLHEEIFYSKDQQQKLFRKISYLILPFAVLICGFSYLDRTNVSFAAMSMLHDLQMSCTDYGLGSGILLLGYSIFQIPSSMIMVRIGAPLYLGIIIMVWGAVTATFAAVQGKTEFVVIRFVIGAVQAGAFPGVWYYITLFYPGTHLTVPFAVIDLGIGIAQVIAPMLAVGFLALDGVLGLSGWRWIFIAEGIPTILFGVIVLAVLPKDLNAAKFISPSQKNWLEYKIGSLEQKKMHCCTKANPQLGFISTLRKGSIWHLSFTRFLKDMTSQGIYYWLPVVIYSMLHQGERKEHKQHTCGKGAAFDEQDKFIVFASILLTIIPYAVAVTAMMIIGHHSQKVGESRVHGGIPCIIGGLALMGFTYIVEYSQIGGLVSLTVSMAGYLSANPCITNLVCAHSCKNTVHVALPLTDSIGIAGGFVGPYLFGWLLQLTGSYTLPTVFLGSVLFLSGVLLLFISEPMKKEAETKVTEQTV